MPGLLEVPDGLDGRGGSYLLGLEDLWGLLNHLAMMLALAL
jgi:hypothetical protein